MKNIVLITGGFDPIHSGHLEYIRAAKDKGDVLVVGLQSDEWLQNKKGVYFLPFEERFKAQQKLSKLPRNSAKIRVRNRCQITGRPHGVYRKLKISRIALRQLGLEGKIPGMVKSSW